MGRLGPHPDMQDIIQILRRISLPGSSHHPCRILLSTRKIDISIGRLLSYVALTLNEVL